MLEASLDKYWVLSGGMPTTISDNDPIYYQWYLPTEDIYHTNYHPAVIRFRFNISKLDFNHLWFSLIMNFFVDVTSHLVVLSVSEPLNMIISLVIRNLWSDLLTFWPTEERCNFISPWSVKERTKRWAQISWWLKRHKLRQTVKSLLTVLGLRSLACHQHSIFIQNCLLL